MNQNYLRMLLETGAISPDDLDPDELAEGRLIRNRPPLRDLGGRVLRRMGEMPDGEPPLLNLGGNDVSKMGAQVRDLGGRVVGQMNYDVELPDNPRARGGGIPSRNALAEMMEMADQHPAMLGEMPENALAELQAMSQQPQMPQPRYDIPKMAPNTMRFEDGPDQGRVVNMDFRQQAQTGAGLPAPQNFPPTRMMGYGGGKVSDLGEVNEAAPDLDQSRPGLEIAGLGKGTYSKDGKNLYIKAPNGGLIKVALGYDREGSRNSAVQAFLDSFKREKAGLDLRRGEQDLQQGDLGMEATRQQMQLRAERAAQEAAARNAPVDPNAPMKLTEVQGKAMTFGERAAEGHEILNAIGQDGKVQPGMIKRIAGAMPGLGMELDQSLGTMLNWTQGKEQQQVEQAQRNFVNAVLRRESGAVISPGEFANATQQYFPQPGDSTEVIAQKKRNREIVVGGLAEESGPAKGKVLESWQKARTAPRGGQNVTPEAARAELKRRGLI